MVLFFSNSVELVLGSKLMNFFISLLNMVCGDWKMEGKIKNFALANIDRFRAVAISLKI